MFQRAVKTPDSPCCPESRRKYSVSLRGHKFYSASEGKFLNFSLVEIIAYRSVDPAPRPYVRACDPSARDEFPTDRLTHGEKQCYYLKKKQFNQDKSAAFEFNKSTLLVIVKVHANSRYCMS